MIPLRSLATFLSLLAFGLASDEEACALDDSGIFDANEEPAYVSLVVNAHPREELEKALSVMQKLGEDRSVKLGEVLILGYNEAVLTELNTIRSQSFPDGFQAPRTKDEFERMKREGKLKLPVKRGAGATDLQKYKIPTLNELSKELFYSTEIFVRYGLRDEDEAEVSEILSWYKLETTPAWIIRQDNEDHVLQGFKQIERYFTTRGRFQPFDDDSATVLSHQTITGVEGSIFAGPAPKTVLYPPRDRSLSAAVLGRSHSVEPVFSVQGGSQSSRRSFHGD